MSVSQVLVQLLRHPVRNLILRWHWKAALLSSCVRALLFFATNVVAGFRAAAGAMIIEFVFRAATSGFYAALTQSFRQAQPAWAATLTAMAVTPAAAQCAEFLVHWGVGTRRLAASMIVSCAFSALSTTFDLFAMRRGVWLVGEARTSFVGDLRRLPSVLGEFLLTIPKALAGVLRPAKNQELKTEN